MTEIFKLDTREVDRIIAALDGNREKVGRSIAFEVEGEAKRRAPYDTTAMLNSIYVVTKDFDGYGQASSQASAKNKDVQTQPHPRPDGDVIARVGPCVNYAEYVELGTSRQAPQPFLTPAAESVFRRVNDGTYWRELVK